jgi:hypothetical protein
MAKTNRYTVDQVVQAIRESNGLLASAAVRLKCRYQTVWSYAQRYPEVQKAIEEQKETVLDLAEGKLYQAIQKGEAWAICFYLKTQGRKRGFLERHDIELTGKDKGPIEVVDKTGRIHDLAKVPDAEIDQAIAEVERILAGA